MSFPPSMREGRCNQTLVPGVRDYCTKGRRSRGRGGDHHTTVAAQKRLDAHTRGKEAERGARKTGARVREGRGETKRLRRPRQQTVVGLKRNREKEQEAC
eukprot:4425716-Pyramimonas_sp.AAC.1